MVDTATTRALARRLEPCHSFIYFSPDAGLGFAGLGLDGGQSYFASRSAPMGAVGPGVVAATFFNFNPVLVRAALPSAWEVATPAAILEVRASAARASLQNYLGDLAAEPALAEITALVRRAFADARPEGRPIFAAHAELAWPEDPLVAWWHAITLAREHRGDAHVAALLMSGLDATEALVLDACAGLARLPKGLVQATRGWSADEWTAAAERLEARGLVAGEDITDAGRALREEIEQQTDDASIAPWQTLSDEEIGHLYEIAQPYSRAIVAGAFGQ